MKADVLALLSCPALREGKGSAERKEGSCGGELAQRDELTLVCEWCGTEYPARSGILRLSPTELEAGRYAQDKRLQDYYEMHYAPYITGTNLSERLCFPPPGAAGSNRGDVKPERLTEVRQGKETDSEHVREFYRSVDMLASYPELTEEFYQTILDLCRPLVGKSTVALDVGCGFGRMTLELSRLGARTVIGLDSSAQMIEEAIRFATAKGDIPVRLNLAGGKTVPAKVTLPSPVKNCAFVVGDAQRLPFRDNVFDLALCLNLIDRVPKPTQVVDELDRVLKSAGRLIISDPYDWESDTTERQHQVTDMADLFDAEQWEPIREIDGIPFVLRSGSNRKISIYLNHCYIYGKPSCAS